MALFGLKMKNFSNISNRAYKSLEIILEHSIRGFTNALIVPMAFM